MKRTVVLLAMFVGVCGGVRAHEVDPPVDAEPAQAAMRYCQTIAVRAAWGAQARFLGAPAQFKYIGEAQLKRLFMGEVADLPHDAIYVLEDMDLEARQHYEEAAYSGWKQADTWIREGRERPEYEVLAALFYHGCKNSLNTGGFPAAAVED